MPIQMVECAFCHKTVTKRSTLSLEQLGAGKGRACRNHEEIVQLVQALTDITELKRKLHECDRNMLVIYAAAAVRVMFTLCKVQPDVSYTRMRFAGVSTGDIQAIQNEVAIQGGPLMSPVEIATAIVH